MAHQVARAIGVGELLEDQLAGGSSLPVRRQETSLEAPSSVEWVNRKLASLKSRITGDGHRAISVSQKLKMARFSEDFVAALGQLPDYVDIDSVGTATVVREEARLMAGTWADRCRDRSDKAILYNEVKSVLADLTTARARLDLGSMRLRSRS